MYVNMCGGVYERGSLLRIWWRWNGTWDRCQVILISELTHLVINSDGDRSPALIKRQKEASHDGMDDRESPNQKEILTLCLKLAVLWWRNVSVSLSVPPSFCLCSLKISLRNSTQSWRRSQTRSSPNRERHSSTWSNTCGRIRSPTAWSTPYLPWVCASCVSRWRESSRESTKVTVGNELSVHRATGLWKDSRWTARASPRSCLGSPLFQRLAWWPGSRPSLRRPGRLAGHALCSRPSGACCVPPTLLRERWARYPLLTLDHNTPKHINRRYIVSKFAFKKMNSRTCF